MDKGRSPSIFPSARGSVHTLPAQFGFSSSLAGTGSLPLCEIHQCKPEPPAFSSRRPRGSTPEPPAWAFPEPHDGIVCNDVSRLETHDVSLLERYGTATMERRLWRCSDLWGEG
ncbi:hypothetical protein U9M48_004936 [Paspalum notatum var. saurae]|uniref:Uncharacterized protein n=1 Tax=Paspalum notatum var. saurae TaxID=547442 RepID=A0AAQ3PLA5_PASNO